MKNSNFRFVLLTALLIAVFMGVLKYHHPHRNYMAHDNFGTYLYLPGLFIYNDLGWENFETLEKINEKYNNTPTWYQFHKAETGYWINRFLMGMAMLFAPFFFIGHAVALNTYYPADGFSAPYQVALVWGGFVYLLIGLFFMSKILARLFPLKTAIFTLIAVYLGTNLLFFAALGNDSPHVYLFSLYCLLIWFTMKWHDQPKIKYAIVIGLVLGILIIARPTEIFAVFIPLLWNITDKDSLKAKFLLVKKHFSHFLILALMMFIIALPQLIYWRIYTGSFFFSPMTDPSQGFDFLKPHFYAALLGFRKGIFIYSPMILLAYIGLFFLYKNKKTLFWPVTVFVVLNTYLLSSHSGLISFGWRAFVQSYAVLTIPLGFFIDAILRKKLPVRIGFVLIFIFLIALNLFQSWQLTAGVLHGSRMTRAYYFAVFGKTEATAEDRKLLLIERSADARDLFKNEEEYESRVEIFNDFETHDERFKGYYDTTHSFSGRYSMRMDSTHRFSPAVRIPYKEITQHDHAWVRASVWVYPVADPLTHEAMLVMTFNHKGNNYKYRAASINLPEYDLKMNTWNLISWDYLTPEPRRRTDQLHTYLWYRGKAPFYIDDFKIEIFEPVQ